MKYFCLLLLFLQSLSAQAQGLDESAEDKSRIITFIENQLSSAERKVDIQGFKGLLSHEATMERLTIADDEGIWLIVEDAHLNWNRAALFQKKLEINALHAQHIQILRKPYSEEESPKMSALDIVDFQLPELPLSIKISELGADKITLGQELLNTPKSYTYSLDTHLFYDEAGVQTTLLLQESANTNNSMRLEFNFDKIQKTIVLDLNVFEETGGLITHFLNIPEAPNLNFKAHSESPLNDIAIDFELGANNEKRLDGIFSFQKHYLLDGAADETLSENPRSATNSFNLAIDGDLRPLLRDDLKRFFGPQSKLTSQGTTLRDGGFKLSNLELSLQDAFLNGTATIGADGLPDFFAFKGNIAREDDQLVRLPTTDNISLRRADFTANFDASKGDQWSSLISAMEVQSPTIELRHIEASGFGDIRKNVDGETEISGQIVAETSGVSLQNQAIGDVIGANQNLFLDSKWSSGSGFRFNSALFATPNIELAGAGQIFKRTEGFGIAGEATAQSDNLNAFSKLIKRNIAGELFGKIQGNYIINTGDFRGLIVGNGTNLQLDHPQVDNLLTGTSTLRLKASRDGEQHRLDEFQLNNSALDISANGLLSQSASDFNFAANLDDMGRLVPELEGPLSLNAQLNKSDASTPWTIAGTLDGLEKANSNVSGTFADDFKTADLAITGQVPLGIINLFTAAVVVRGQAQFDLNLNGPLALSSLSGTIEGENTALAIAPVQMAFDLAKASAQLNGNSAVIELQGRSRTGGEISATGLFSDLQARIANIDIEIANLLIKDPTLYETSISGALNLSGTLPQSALIAGDLELNETNIKITPADVGGNGKKLGIKHVGLSSDAEQTLRDARFMDDENNVKPYPNIGLDIDIIANNQIFIRGRGIDAELSGEMNIGGSTRNIEPSGGLSLVRGRMSLLGRRIDIQEGSLTLQGSFNPNINLNALTNTDDLEINIAVSGQIREPELTFTSTPTLPEEEILAQYLFGRDFSEISAFQAAQLAAAVATLAGAGGDFVERIRSEIGVDDIDFQTSDDGTSQLRVGKYISDNVYTDATVDNEGRSEINLNLDATDDITFRGSAANDGETSLGVFFERDY